MTDSAIYIGGLGIFVVSAIAYLQIRKKFDLLEKIQLFFACMALALGVHFLYIFFYTAQYSCISNGHSLHKGYVIVGGVTVILVALSVMYTKISGKPLQLTPSGES